MQAATNNRDKEMNVKADMKSPKLGRNGQPLSRLALLVERITTTSSRSQREIADIAGFKNQNIITMIKQGESKLPLDRVPGMARALNVDPYELFQLALEQYYSHDVRAELLEIIPPALSKDERQVIDIIRQAQEKGAQLTPERVEAIQKVFE